MDTWKIVAIAIGLGVGVYLYTSNASAASGPSTGGATGVTPPTGAQTERTAWANVWSSFNTTLNTIWASASRGSGTSSTPSTGSGGTASYAVKSDRLSGPSDPNWKTG